jgi:hypothetical protein
LPEPPATEYLPVEVFNTNASGSVSKPELTGNTYFDEKLVEKQKSEIAPPTPVLFVAPRPEPKSGFNIFWLLPIFALGLLSVAGVGGIIWMNSPNSAEPTKPVSNAVNSAPTSASTISPTSPSITPKLTPTPVTTSSNPVMSSEKTKPTIAPTIDKTPIIQNPVKTPAVRKTVKPKPSQNPNCILTDSCQ